MLPLHSHYLATLLGQTLGKASVYRELRLRVTLMHSIQVRVYSGILRGVHSLRRQPHSRGKNRRSQRHLALNDRKPLQTVGYEGLVAISRPHLAGEPRVPFSLDSAVSASECRGYARQGKYLLPHAQEPNPCARKLLKTKGKQSNFFDNIVGLVSYLRNQV